jgi:hypothetical protein
MADRTSDALDPRGLISEAYLIPGISPVECRSIFFDWAVGRGDAEGEPAAAAVLLSHHEALHPDHPMTDVLREGRLGLRAPARRGGRRRSGGPDDAAD